MTPGNERRVGRGRPPANPIRLFPSLHCTHSSSHSSCCSLPSPSPSLSSFPLHLTSCTARSVSPALVVFTEASPASHRPPSSFSCLHLPTAAPPAFFDTHRLSLSCCPSRVPLSYHEPHEPYAPATAPLPLCTTNAPRCLSLFRSTHARYGKPQSLRSTALDRC